MDHNLEIWIIAGCIALSVSAVVQLFFMAAFLRVAALLRPAPGRPSPSEILDKVIETTATLERVTKSMAQMLDELKPVVDQVSTVSLRQVNHADQVVGEVLTTVERINSSVNSAISRPFREAHALSAAVRTAATALFKTNDNSYKGKRW
jgi:hypothetical protein